MKKHIVKIITGISVTALICGICIFNPSDGGKNNEIVKAKADTVSGTYDSDSFESLLKKDKQNMKTNMGKYYGGYGDVNIIRETNNIEAGDCISTGMYIKEGDKEDLKKIYEKEAGLYNQ